MTFIAKVTKGNFTVDCHFSASVGLRFEQKQKKDMFLTLVTWHLEQKTIKEFSLQDGCKMWSNKSILCLTTNYPGEVTGFNNQEVKIKHIEQSSKLRKRPTEKGEINYS
jgi:PP-loop superfamily ATP-utilizing enzyme